MLARLSSLCCIVLLSGCSSTGQGILDLANSVRGVSGNQANTAQLDPRYRYLRVTLRGESTTLILGYVDDTPAGPVETWYSPRGQETLRLQNGRYVGGSGLPVEWRDVRLSAQPAWRDVTHPIQFTRQRDVMPSYEYGLTDTLTVKPIPMPRSTDFYGRPPADLHWYEEVSTGDGAIPPVRYAVSLAGGSATVVYGELCLNRGLCLSWQRWPANS